MEASFQCWWTTSNVSWHPWWKIWRIQWHDLCTSGRFQHGLSEWMQESKEVWWIEGSDYAGLGCEFNFGWGKVVCIFFPNAFIICETESVKLQEVINALVFECLCVGRHINIDNMVHSFFCKHPWRYPSRMPIETEVIPLSHDLIKYLGGLIKCDGTFSLHTNEKFNATVHAFGGVIQICKRYSCVSLNFTFELTATLIHSIANYMCEIWSFDSISRTCWG